MLATVPFNASDAQDLATVLANVAHLQMLLKVLLVDREAEVEAVHAVIMVVAVMPEVVDEAAAEVVATMSMKLR